MRNRVRYIQTLLFSEVRLTLNFSTLAAVTSIPPGSTTVNESEMAILTQRIAFMLGGQNAMDRLLKNPNENADLARVSHYFSLSFARTIRRLTRDCDCRN